MQFRFRRNDKAWSLGLCLALSPGELDTTDSYMCSEKPQHVYMQTCSRFLFRVSAQCNVRLKQRQTDVWN
jgi:hypothetical protein